MALKYNEMNWLLLNGDLMFPKFNKIEHELILLQCLTYITEIVLMLNKKFRTIKSTFLTLLVVISNNFHNKTF